MGKSKKKVAKEKKGKAAKVAAVPEAKATALQEAKPKGELSKEMQALRQQAAVTLGCMQVAQEEAEKLEAKGKALVVAARKAYLEALEPYREACKQAGIPCEFQGERAANLTPMVRFLVEKVEKGVKVTVKGKPDTEETIPFKALKESVSKEAYGYTDKHIGPKAEIGNKGGGLANRIKAVMA